LKKVIDLDPKSAKAFYLSGLMYGEKGDNHMKQYYLDKAYKLDPSLKDK
jgi:hypothetical protein